jgi:hypothetical protein
MVTLGEAITACLTRAGLRLRIEQWEAMQADRANDNLTPHTDREQPEHLADAPSGQGERC